jgi:hypothetical protein
MTETIDKLYLELSLISKAKTAKEIELENKIKDMQEEINRLSKLLPG